MTKQNRNEPFLSLYFQSNSNIIWIWIKASYFISIMYILTLTYSERLRDIIDRQKYTLSLFYIIIAHNIANRHAVYMSTLIYFVSYFSYPHIRTDNFTINPHWISNHSYHRHICIYGDIICHCMYLVYIIDWPKKKKK